MPKKRSRRKKAVTSSEGEKSVTTSESGKKSATTSESCDRSEEEATEEISSKEQMRLYCTHRNLIGPIPFDILQGTNLNKRYHDIISEPPADYMLERYNYVQKYILTPVNYDFTLKEKIDSDRGEFFDHDYEDWGIVRPAEWVRKLLVAMIKVVFNLHEKNCFHGALQYAENYAVRNVYNFKTNRDDDVEVILLYTNEDKDRLDNITEIRDGVEIDLMGLSHVIFEEILFGKDFKTYPQDLRDLHSLLTGDVSSIPKKRWLITSHPTLWPSETRFDYFEKIWKAYENGSTETKGLIEGAAARVRDAKNWQKKIPVNTPFYQIYLKNRYSPDGLGLVHYVRITFRHLNESRKKTGIKVHGLEGSSYENEKYVEAMMTKLFPMLVTDLYAALREVGVFF